MNEDVKYSALTESVKERVRQNIYGRRGQIVYESILIKDKVITEKELSLICSLFSDYFGDWNDIWEAYDRIVERETNKAKAP